MYLALSVRVNYSTVILILTLHLFRFTALEILELVQALDIPDPFITKNWYNFTAVEVISLLLIRLRAGFDQYVLVSGYDRCQSSISEVLNELSEYLDEQWEHILTCDREGIFHPDQLATYADAISVHGAPLHNCFAFLDCTICKTCRPTEGQGVAYNGYKKMHALKYQALVLPNGLIGHLAGPYKGC